MASTCRKYDNEHDVSDHSRVEAKKAMEELYRKINVAIRECQFSNELNVRQGEEIRSVIARHMISSQVELEALFEVWLAAKIAERAKFLRGEAVVIVDHSMTPGKAAEWHKKDGVYRLKLWEPYKTHSAWSGDSTSLRAVRSKDNKIVSWPAGTVGFVDLDYSVKRLQHDTKNIRVKFDGYVGWTDYRNLAVYTHSDDEPGDDS